VSYDILGSNADLECFQTSVLQFVICQPVTLQRGIDRVQDRYHAVYFLTERVRHLRCGLTGHDCGYQPDQKAKLANVQGGFDHDICFAPVIVILVADLCADTAQRPVKPTTAPIMILHDEIHSNQHFSGRSRTEKSRTGPALHGF
jgi:hypothetical protein